MSKRNEGFHRWSIVTFMAFLIVGSYSLSNLTPLIFGLGSVEIHVFIVSLVIFSASLFILGRTIYQIDREQNRVRRRIRWFEPRKKR